MPLRGTAAAGDSSSPPDADYRPSRANPSQIKSGSASKPEFHGCSHCGLPVPLAFYDATRENNYCCSGCETVHHLLTHAGLADYYAFRERLGESGRKVGDAQSSLEEFDSPSFQKLYCQQLPEGIQRTELLLSGVHCAACVWLVERISRLEPAVSLARLDLSRSVVELHWDPSQAPLSQIASTFAKMGYQARPSRAQEAERMRRRELRNLLIRIGVAGASAGNVMLMAFALYSGAVGIDEAQTMAPETTRFFRVASLVVSLPALWAGSLFFRGAWASLRTRTPHMDLPIALGIGVAFVYGTFGVFADSGEMYFDSITALVFFLLIGRYLQRRHQMAESDAMELLAAVVPGSAVRVNPDGSQHEMASADVTPGQTVRVHSGGIVPVDGVIESGRSSLDKSLLSGESRPVSVGPGDDVEAGALNLGAALTVTALRSGDETRVAELMRHVEQALSTRTPLIHRADRFAGFFTVAVLALAAVVFCYWSWFSLASGMDRALAVLIVACPCALGLATPLGLSAAVHKAASGGKLVFAPQALEQLARRTELVLDKTGTLTEGKLDVLRLDGDRDYLHPAAAAESDMRHPVARALCEYAAGAKRNGLEPAHSAIEMASVREVLGAGVSAQYRGKPLLVGSDSFVRRQAKLPAHLADCYRHPPAGASTLLIAWDGQVRTILWLGDRLRSDAAVSLSQLRARGHRLHLLSGDQPRRVLEVADELRRLCEDPDLFQSVRGGVSPEEKLAAVASLAGAQSAADHRPVVMIGDGINDAGALARADVGIAVQGAAEASRLSADVYLARPGVSEILSLIEGSQRTLSIITRGLVFSLFYNALGIVGAASGLLGPLGAAVLMPLSSLTVVTNAYRSRSFGSVKDEETLLAVPESAGK